MQIVPLQSLPNQIVDIILGDQQCVLKVYQKFFGLYIDVTVSGELIIGGVIGRDRNRVVRSEYLGFIGDLVFFDLLGGSDPDYASLGTQFLLAYLDEEDLAAQGLS
jgi:hypothetical protein